MDDAGRRKTTGGDAASGLSSRQLEPLVEVLVCAVRDNGFRMERGDVRRAVHEAVRMWPGEPERRWWKWLVEAGASLDLRVSVIEDTVDDILRWVQEGVQVVGYFKTDAADEWLYITRGRGSKYVFRSSDRDFQTSVVSREGLRRTLSAACHEGVARVVALEPALTCGEARHGESSPTFLSPSARLARIVRAEWSDIWVILVFALLSGILALATPMAVQVMVSFVAFGKFMQPVIILSLMLLALMAFWAMLRLWETYVAEILQRRFFARVAHDLSYRLPRVRQDALDGTYGPELANRFFDVVTLQKVTTQLLVDAVDLVMVVVIGMVVLAIYHPYLLGFDLILLASIAVIIFVLGRGGARTSILESKYKYLTAAWLEEMVRCPLTFKLDNAPEFAGERAEHLVSGYLDHRSRHFRILFRQITFALVLHAAAGSVLLGVGGWLVIHGQLTLGQLVAAEMIVAIIVGAFTKVGKHLEAFYDLMAAMDKLGVLFDLPLERQQGLMRLPETRPAHLCLRNISCRMDGHSVWEDMSFDLRSGERVALTGPSGSGKSVLADLLYGLREPARGRILLDDHEILEVRPDVWRRHVMLLRPGELFHGTVMENIHLDNPDIDERLVREACERLGLLHAEAMPDGLATMLSSSGAPLSGSQQRLVILARALVHQPRLLIVDELLDSLSEDALEPALDILFAPSVPWTLLLISARGPVLARCDREINLARHDPGIHSDEFTTRR